MKKVGYLMLFAALVLGLAVAGCFLAAIWIDGPKNMESNFLVTAFFLIIPFIILVATGSQLVAHSERR